MFTQDEKCLLWAQKPLLHRVKGAKQAQKSAPCVFDIGHNTGEFTKTVFGLLGPSTSVHAFEPNPDVEFLYRDSANVTINRIAIAKEKGSLPLFVPTFHNETSSSSHLASLINRPCFSSFDHSYIKTVTVPVTTVDEYCAEHGIDYIDYLKVDTEGYELDVFLGARHMLHEKKVACGQFEIGSTFTERGYTVKEVVELLHSLGYACFIGETIPQNRLLPNDAVNMVAQRSVDGWENILFVNLDLMTDVLPTKIDISGRYLETEEVRSDSTPYKAYYDMLASVFDFSKIQSFCDVGCASGCLQQILKQNHPKIAIHGFEFFEFQKNAAPCEVVDTIQIVDLRDPLDHGTRYDLVNCTEVGEHIDPAYSSVFLQNLKLLTGRFLVMSWSDSGGEHDSINDPHHQHLNPLTKSDFIKMMAANGFELQKEATERLIQGSYLPHFHDWWRKSLTVWKVKQ